MLCLGRGPESVEADSAWDRLTIGLRDPGRVVTRP